MTRSHPFWQRLTADSELCDHFLALVQEHMVLENSVDRISDTTPLDFQRGKIALLRALQSTATAIAKKKE